MNKLNFFRLHSIKNELVIPLITAFLISTFLITSLVLYHNDKIVEEVLTELRNEMLSLVNNSLNNKLSEALRLNKINYDNYNNGVLSLYDETYREKYFYSLIKNFDDVAMTYIGLPNGEFYGIRRNLDNSFNVVRNNKSTNGNSDYYSIDSSGKVIEKVQTFKNFDPRKRPWYTGAIKNKTITFSSIYSHFVFKEPTLTASIPVYKNSDLVAVFGVDFLMTWLNNVLKKLPIGPHGQVFIIDENENIVATTTGEDIFKLIDGKSQNIKGSQTTNPITLKVINLSKDKSNKFKVNNKEYLVGKDHFLYAGINWTIYTVILKDDFLGNSKTLFFKAFISVLIISVIFIIITLIIIKHIISPILKLNESAKNLTLGIYEEVPLIKDKNEIYELTQNFNIMAKNMTNLLEHLSQEVKIRTLELEEKNEILKRYSYIDELMQIPNRRKFDEMILEVMDLSSRNQRPIGLMMIDIDDFKSFNDNYGHIAGDVCLKKVGLSIKACIKRKTDLVARFGGEELVVILQELEYEDALMIAEQIRKNIENLKIINKKSNSGYVTVSIGVFFGNTEPFQTPEEIIGYADELMYTAKKLGKNRFEALRL